MLNVLIHSEHDRWDHIYHMVRLNKQETVFYLSVTVFMHLSVSGISTSVHFVDLCLRELRGGCVDIYACQC